MVREREEPLVVGLGLLDEAPVVAEGLDVRLPDLAQLVLGDRADLETFRERMIGEVVDGGPNHLGCVRDRLVAGATDERSRGDVSVADPGLVELLGGVVLGGDLAQAGFVPCEERATDPTAAVLRVDEADVPVDARPVRLLIPPDPAVRDREPVDFGDHEVARGIAAVEMLVARRDSLGSLDAVVPLARAEAVMMRAKSA